jgi:hypothetical protein
VDFLEEHITSIFRAKKISRAKNEHVLTASRLLHAGLLLV